jgi:polysaccharide deacetylase family protein (PEP-CTERM system associated)
MKNDKPFANDLIKEVSETVPFGQSHAFSVDVEEWFQVGAYEDVIGEDSWPSRESRVDFQTSLLLDICAEYNVKATFFTLGYVAKTNPELIRKIVDGGHEIACHGLDHKRLFTLSENEFIQTTSKAKSLLEDLSGNAVLGYRAPSFSLNKDVWWAYEALIEMGFAYSSSLYPIKHDHYGMPDAPTRPFFPLGEGIIEIPMMSYKILGRSLAVSGGGYFRLLPYVLGKSLFERGTGQNKAPGVFYTHPWEYDPDQPRIKEASVKSNFRHHVGQRGMQAKLRKLLMDFDWGTVHDVIYAPISEHMQIQALK